MCSGCLGIPSISDPASIGGRRLFQTLRLLKVLH